MFEMVELDQRNFLFFLKTYVRKLWISFVYSYGASICQRKP
jgi:hypothetical protein